MVAGVAASPAVPLPFWSIELPALTNSNCSDADAIIPASPLTVSTTSSVQLPLAFMPLTTLSGDSGRNEPTKGDVPALIGFVA